VLNSYGSDALKSDMSYTIIDIYFPSWQLFTLRAVNLIHQMVLAVNKIT
jgi:hypothetical protein